MHRTMYVNKQDTFPAKSSTVWRVKASKAVRNAARCADRRRGAPRWWWPELRLAVTGLRGHFPCTFMHLRTLARLLLVVTLVLSLVKTLVDQSFVLFPTTITVTEEQP